MQHRYVYPNLHIDQYLEAENIGTQPSHTNYPTAPNQYPNEVPNYPPPYTLHNPLGNY